jgi:anti-sigma-K factor RskA
MTTPVPGPADEMDANPDVEAGEYVLGTLTPARQRELVARLPHDSALREQIQAWEQRLLPLTALVPATPTPAHLWQRIAASVKTTPMGETATASTRLQAGPVPAPRQAALPWRVWNSLAMWRCLAAGAVTTAVALAVVLVTGLAAPLAPTQFMVVLVAPQDKAPGWVIQASMSRQISLIPLGTVNVPPNKSLQFWTKGDGWSGPVSLGLVQPGRAVKIRLDQLPPLQANQLFELTLEPAGGSPIAKPTGPVQFIGRAVSVL